MNKLQLTEQDHRTLHELQNAFAALPSCSVRGAEGSAELEPTGLMAMVERHWNETAVAERHRLGSALAFAGEPPADLLAPLYEVLERMAASMNVEPQFSVLLKAAFVDLQAVLDGYSETSQGNLRRALELMLEARMDLHQFGQFASHDLKTPLATVANLCDEALDEFGEQIPAPARTLIAKARNRVFQTSEIIDGLLESATHHHATQADTELSLESVLADATKRLRTGFPHRSLQVDLPEGLPPVKGDPLRIREAMYQVFANALASSDKAVAEIDVSAEIEGKQCLLRISDNGPAVTATESRQIFYPFFRTTRLQEVSGSGLRLYLAKLLIEQQGGRIWAKSRSGRSAQILVSLPMSDTNSHC